MLAADSVREHVAELRQAMPQLRALCETIDAPQDMLFATVAHWYAVALHFRPDVILELGRGYGNSTAVLLEAANKIGARVVSFDLNPGWLRRKALERLRPRTWFDAIDLRHGDLTTERLEAFAGARTLVVWDAHGFEIAEAVLGRLLPAIASLPHVVVCHDIADNRFAFQERSYEGRPLWRGMDDYYSMLRIEPRAFFNLGWATGAVDQIIPILDFCHRNAVALHSADADLAAAGPHGITEISHPVSWAWFTLNEGSPPFHFPARANHRPLDHAETRVREILSSTSWRVTAPLRALANLVRRARRWRSPATPRNP